MAFVRSGPATDSLYGTRPWPACGPAAVVTPGRSVPLPGIDVFGLGQARVVPDHVLEGGVVGGGQVLQRPQHLRRGAVVAGGVDEAVLLGGERHPAEEGLD